MFVARALTVIGPMAGTRSNSQPINAGTTVAVEGWVEDPARPVQIINGGSEFVMPAAATVRIDVSLQTSNSFEPSIRLNGNVIASKGAESNPSISAENVEVQDGDTVSVFLRNPAFTGNRQVTGGTFTITPV